MKYIKKLIRNSKRALNQQVIKKKQEIVKYAPRLTGIQVPRRKALIACVHQKDLNSSPIMCGHRRQPQFRRFQF